MTNLFRLLLFFFVISSPANAVELSKYYKEPLTDTDKAGIIAFNILQTIDLLQTLEITRNDNYYETNPILGRDPSDALIFSYFIARGIAHYHTTKMIPEKYRNVWHGANILYNYDVIQDNHNLGIRINF